MIEDDEIFDADDLQASAPASGSLDSADELFDASPSGEAATDFASSDEVFDADAGADAEGGDDDMMFADSLDPVASSSSGGTDSGSDDDDMMFADSLDPVASSSAGGADSGSDADDMMFADSLDPVASAAAGASAAADASGNPSQAQASAEPGAATVGGAQAAPDELLSKGEIDALMESVDGTADAIDASDDGEYKRVDFAAREQSMLRELTALSSLVERQAELLANALEDAFSLEFVVRSAPIELLFVNDALASLDRAVGVSTTTLAPLKGPVFVISPAPLLSHVVNAYFGGRSISAPQAESRVSLTPTELRVAERIADIQLQCLCNAWLDKLPMEAGETNTLGVADRLEMLPRTELLMRIRLMISEGDLTTNLDVLLSFAELEPYRERFSPPRKKELEIDLSASWEPFFRRELPVIELELAGVLATKTMPLSEVLGLAEGMVIPISAPEEVSVRVDDLELAAGRYGTHEGMKAIQVDHLTAGRDSAGH